MDCKNFWLNLLYNFLNLVFCFFDLQVVIDLANFLAKLLYIIFKYGQLYKNNLFNISFIMLNIITNSDLIKCNINKKIFLILKTFIKT